MLSNCDIGRFKIIEFAIKIDDNKMLIINNNFVPFNSSDNFKRHDQLLVKIFYKLGKKMNGDQCKLGITRIPKKYEECYYFTEIESCEFIHIDYFRYKCLQLHNDIKNILQNNSTNDDKVNRMNEYINTSSIPKLDLFHEDYKDFYSNK